MKLTCPNCAAGFEVRAEALGPAGRKVRCSACGTQWTARAAAAPAPAPAPAAPVAAMPVAAVPVAPAPLPPEPALSPVEPEPLGEPEVEPPDIAALREAAILHPSAPSPPPREDYVAAPPPERVAPPPTRAAVRPPRHWGALAGWALLAAVLAGLGVAVALREDVMAAFPQTREVFRAFGFNIGQPATDLDIVDTRPTWSRNTADGQPTLVIEGRVKNMSSAARDIPQLRAVLRNGTVDVHSWTFTATAPRVPGGGEVAFRTEARAPPAATTVVVVFALAE